MPKRKKTGLERLAELTVWATAAAERVRAERAAKARAAHQAAQRRLTEFNAKRRAERQRALAEANRAARLEADPSRLDRRRVADAPGWRVLLERMEPGRWYDQPELVALAPEYARGSVKAWLAQKMLAGGFVERAPNADYDAARPDRRQTEARWLYRRV